MFDPVHEDDGKWYFFDPAFYDRYGPYPTEAVARHAHARYNGQYVGPIEEPNYLDFCL